LWSGGRRTDPARPLNAAEHGAYAATDLPSDHQQLLDAIPQPSGDGRVRARTSRILLGRERRQYPLHSDAPDGLLRAAGAQLSAEAPVPVLRDLLSALARGARDLEVLSSQRSWPDPGWLIQVKSSTPAR
jgi:hypothetical protein